jgi:V/A-type H+-transporting ATPase subunit D
MRQVAANPGQVRLLRRQLEGYRRVLPSLDLKRRQLAAALASERSELARARGAVAACIAAAGRTMPMLAAVPENAAPPVSLQRTPAEPQLIAGIAVEGFAGLQPQATVNPVCASAAWTDGLVAALGEAAALQLRAREREQRAAQLDVALRKASQRVNLLEKLLIPRTARRLRTVEVLLGDLKRSDVIRAKIAKARRPA